MDFINRDTKQQKMKPMTEPMTELAGGELCLCTAATPQLSGSGKTKKDKFFKTIIRPAIDI